MKKKEIMEFVTEEEKLQKEKDKFEITDLILILTKKQKDGSYATSYSFKSDDTENFNEFSARTSCMFSRPIESLSLCYANINKLSVSDMEDFWKKICEKGAEIYDAMVATAFAKFDETLKEIRKEK